MDSSISKQIKSIFDLASWKHELKTLTKPSDIAKANEISERYQQKTQELNKRYKAEYGSRLYQTMKSLIDKAGAKERHYTHRWFGEDKFNKQALHKEARNIVLREHQMQLVQLAQNEAGELEDLIQKVRQRDNIKQEFKRSTDRRSGKERRQTPKRHR